MTQRCLQFVLLFLALVSSAQGEWKILSTESQFGRDPKIVHRHLVVEDRTRDVRADCDLVLFDTPHQTLRLIDNPDGESARRVFANENCVAGVNGGYFDPEFAPLGLRMSHGKVLSPLRRARLITGVLVATPRGIEIERANAVRSSPVFETALQCGPFLVDHGKPVPGLDNSRIARRTFAATGRRGKAVLGVCSSVSLAQLSQILAVVKLSDGVKIERALNFDGGSSSAFWFARENGSAFSIPEQKPVRDFVGVISR